MLVKLKEILIKILLAVYLVLSAGTAAYYFRIGQWKAIIRFWGVVDALLVLVGVILFILYCCQRNVKRSLWVVHILLIIMQVFPMLGSFLLSGYAWNGIVSLILLMLGVVIAVLRMQMRNIN